MREFTSNSAKAFASYIAECHAANHNSPILWMGAGCSISSGCLSDSSLLQQASEKLGIQIGSHDELSRLITEHHQDLMFNQLLRGNGTGLGYSLLAQVIGRGYFRILLTTNWDLLLEGELRKVVAPQKLIVLSRGSSPDEQIAKRLATLKPDNILLLRLHGDLQTVQINQSTELLELSENLQRELRTIIARDGIAFIGYSFTELRLANLLPATDKMWAVEPFDSPRAFLNQYGIREERCIRAEDALFDNFSQGLCRELLTKAFFKDRIQGAEIPDRREQIDTLVHDIIRALKADSIDDYMAERLTSKILEKILVLASHLDNKVCLVFANDADAPGGIEIRNLVERRTPLRRLVRHLQSVTINLKSRVGISSEDRIVTSIEPDINFAGFKAVVILDDISFSGNTLRIVKRYLEQRTEAASLKFATALLRIERHLREQLEAEGWEVFWGEEHKGFGLMCPWGFTRPTRAKFGSLQTQAATRLGELSLSSFFPQESFGFVPKPWGELVVFRDNAHGSSRILYLERGQRTSLHYHLLRDEIFFVLDDRVRIRLWDRYVELSRHQSIRVPAGVPHGLIALESACRVLEIAEGFYEAQLDIVRLADVYGRKKKPFGDDGLI